MIIIKSLKRFKNFYFLVGLLFSTIVIYKIMGHYTDSDMWFILANGREILENGIPHENPFTYIQGLDIVVQQWLWSVVTWVLYDILGSYGLALICIVLYAIAIILCVKLCDSNEMDKNFTFMIVSMLFAFFGGSFLNVRPTMVTVILLLFQVLIINKYIKSGNWKILLWLILISLLEINFHSSLWLMHFVFIIPYVFPAIRNKLVKFKQIGYNRKPLLLVMIPMFLVGFINPYGVEGILYLVKSYNSELKSLGIQELMSPTMLSFLGMLFIVSWLVIAFIVFRNKEKEWDSYVIYFVCGLSLFGIMHLRNVIYFLVGLAIFISYASRNIKDVKIKGTEAATVAVPVICVVFIVMGVLQVPSKMKVKDEPFTPVKAVEYIKDVGAEDKNIFTDFNQGSYLEYNRIKVFMDARPELYTKKVNGSKDILKDYLKVAKAKSSEDFDKFLNKYDFDYVMVTVGGKMNIYLENNDNYKVVVDSEYYNLYEKVK